MAGRDPQSGVGICFRVLLGDESFQGVDVLEFIEWFVDGGLGDEGGVSEALVVEQAAEDFGADAAESDVLVAIKF